MDIILLENHTKLGDKYDVVSVKDGYARNFLIPQKMALIANKTNLARLADFRNREAAKEAKMLGTYQEMAASLDGKVLRIGAKAGTSGKIFGSVTNVQIIAALQEQMGIELQRRKVVLPEDVKMVGAYTAQLLLHPEVTANLAFEVVAE